MNSLRKIVFWCHLLCGVIAGVVILTMSVTGVILTYEKQAIVWADTRGYRVEALPGAMPLPIEALLAKVREGQAAVPVSVTARADRSMPLTVGLQGGRSLFVNPYTGAILGEGAPTVRRFFQRVTDWHRWLGTEGAGRTTARAITGACNLAFLFIVVSGLYLWFPRQLNWSRVRQVILFRRGLPGKARDFNWHNVIGFWSGIPLFLVVLSATVISYQWASNLAYRVVGEKPPTPAAPAARPSGPGQSQPFAGDPLAGLDRLWSLAEQHTPGWKTLSLRLPTSAEAPLAFTIDRGTGGEPQKRATLTLSRESGSVVKYEDFGSFSPGRQLRTTLRFLHTGEVAGLVGQTIAGIASFGVIILGWTGFALAWRRFRDWVARR